jgi:hypothetical protein
MKPSQSAFLLFAAVVAQQSEEVSALQNVFSRKAFVSKVAGTATLVAASSGVLTGNPAGAAARDGVLTARIKDRAVSPSSTSAPDAKGGKKELFRGGKNLSDALHNGTDLDKGQAAVAGGLLDKMGLKDITPDKGPNSRAPPTTR